MSVTSSPFTVDMATEPALGDTLEAHLETRAVMLEFMRVHLFLPFEPAGGRRIGLMPRRMWEAGLWRQRLD